MRIPVLVNTIKNAVSLTERDLSRRQAAGDECFRVFGSPPPSGGEKNLPPPCVVEASLQYQRPGEKPKGVKPDCQLSGAAGPPYEFCQSLTRLFSESVKVDCLAKECPTNDQRRSRSPRHATRGLARSHPLTPPPIQAAVVGLPTSCGGISSHTPVSHFPAAVCRRVALAVVALSPEGAALVA